MLSAYEQQRQANIARNKRALQLLGLDTGILPREKKTKKRQRRKASPRASTRHSTRVAKQPTVDYSREKVLDPAGDGSDDSAGDDSDETMANIGVDSAKPPELNSHPSPPRRRTPKPTEAIPVAAPAMAAPSRQLAVIAPGQLTNAPAADKSVMAAPTCTCSM